MLKFILPLDRRVVYAHLPRRSSGEKRIRLHDRNSEMVQGTLDMLILRTLITGPAHGHTIAHVIEHTSENVLEVEQGSLYPALHRLEHRGWVTSYWGVSENNRKAKFYKLTAAGKEAAHGRDGSLADGGRRHRAHFGGEPVAGFDWLRSSRSFLRALRGP